MKRLFIKLISAGAWISVFMFTFTSPVGAQGVLGIIAAETSTPPLPVKEDKKLIAEESVVLSVPELPLEDSSRYTLGVNDVIQIEVLRHPEVSGEYVINNEGKIQYEFVGDVSVVGKTKEEVHDLLVDLLSKYIIDPNVTVKITGYNSKAVYVIGEVGRPGKIFMRGDTITVREALVQAGLPTLGASTRKCRLITPSENGKANIEYVNVFNLLYEGDLNENLVMKPGDTLYIPATIMTKAMRAISPVTQPIGAVGGAGQSVMYGF